MYSNELKTKTITFKRKDKLNHNNVLQVKNKFRLKCSNLG